MSTLKLETVQWASLQDIDHVEPVSDKDHAVLVELKEVLLKHGYTNRFGVCLLHRHYDISQDEIILETPTLALEYQSFPYKRMMVVTILLKLCGNFPMILKQ